MICYFFQKIAECCPLLESLSLSWCDEISDVGLTAVLKSCKQLRKLKILQCPKLSGRSVQRLRSSSLSPNLLILILFLVVFARWCLFPSSQSSSNDASACPLSQLESLSLSDRRWLISDRSLLLVGRSCSRLQELSLFGVCAVTEEAMTSIALGCRALSVLDLTNCEVIGPSGLRNIMSTARISAACVCVDAEAAFCRVICL